jgi:ABC-type transport system substrate-binding protein
MNKLLHTLLAHGLAAAAALVPAVPWAQAQTQTQTQAPTPVDRKVLKLAFVRAETTLDPARIVDLYSRNVTGHIFEGLYQWDHLARPPKMQPLTADGMPQPSPDFRTWTVKVQPGIYFADDPAFKGQKRELVAADYAYAIRRFVDPANKSPVLASFLDYGILGLKELHEDAVKNKRPLDYDKPLEGLQTPDRYTLQIRLKDPRPRFASFFAGSDLTGAVAREVVEHYRDDIGAHPVGTGPFKLKSWRRNSEIVLERNPAYRPRFYSAEPAPDDAAGQAMLKAFKGRRLPMVDEVRIAIIEEDQPLWLAFLNGQVDALATNAGRVPPTYLAQSMPGGKLAPYLAKRGIQATRTLNADASLFFFNMEDPLVGGYTPEKVALRRAISLAYDAKAEIQQIRRGGILAQSAVVPHTSGYDPTFKSPMSDYSPTRAKALLDLYGYVDRDGDGWREQPDGRPLVIEIGSQSDQYSRQFDELWKRSLSSINVKVVFKTAQWPENLKAARAGKMQLWWLSSSAAGPDGQESLTRLYGPQSGSQNIARFKNADFDRIFERMRVIPDGPERDKGFLELKRLSAAWMPYRYVTHRMEADMLHGHVKGYRRPVFWLEWWHLVDLEGGAKEAP